MTRFRSIRRVSRAMSVVCVMLGAALFVSVAWVWLIADREVWRLLTEELLHGVVVAELTMVKRCLGFGLMLLPLSFTLMALARLSGVFRRYGRGEIFTQGAVDRLSAVGVWVTAAVIAKIVVTPMLSVAMTYDNPPGQRMLSVAVSSNDLIFLVLAVTFCVLAWVMSEARRISDDLNQIV